MDKRTRREFLLTISVASVGVFAAACGVGQRPESSPTLGVSSSSAAAPSASGSPAASPTNSVSSGSAAAKPGATNVKIADIQIASAAGSYIADAKGYFREEDIQAEFVRMATGDQIAALLSNTVDVAGAAMNAQLYNGLARGVSIKMVADHGSNLQNASASGFAVRKDLVDSGKYKGPADCKGWKIAVGGPPSTVDIDLDRFLGKGGLSVKDIDHVIISFPDMIAAFANKNIDAAMYQEPFTTIALNQGLIVRGPIGYDIYPNHQIAAVTFAGKLASDRDLGIRYLRAYTRGVRDYVKGLVQKDQATFDQVVPILIDHTAVKQRELFQQAIPSGLRADPVPNAQSIIDDLNYFLERGIVTQRFDVSQYIDVSLVGEAIKQLGPAK